MSEPADRNHSDAQLGKPPADPDLEAAERDERQTERQAPDDAGPGEAAG